MLFVLLIIIMDRGMLCAELSSPQCWRGKAWSIHWCI